MRDGRNSRRGPGAAWNATAIKDGIRACLVGILDRYMNAIFTRNPKAVPPLALTSA